MQPGRRLRLCPRMHHIHMQTNAGMAPAHQDRPCHLRGSTRSHSHGLRCSTDSDCTALLQGLLELAEQLVLDDSGSDFCQASLQLLVAAADAAPSLYSQLGSKVLQQHPSSVPGAADKS